mmetsp:Transcript_27918/g.31927  ORF Transcript_27918/g.31927 Transcript_27918/m.31927 type:complete len:344 (+) Transcript_27918:80-1111(+)
MDNEAFRKFVLEKDQPKDTKKIAREIVEKEFSRKKKRRKNDDDSSDEDDIRRKRDRKQNDSQKNIQKKNNKREEDYHYKNEYRDRAKERREKNDQDYPQPTIVQEETKDSVLTKYQGGDEAKTHLIKGLDLALSRKIKQAKLIDSNEKIDSVLKTKEKKQEKCVLSEKKEATPTLDTASDAHKWLHTNNVDDIKSKLGKSMLSFLKESFLSHLPKPLDVTPAGLTIQRSTLRFSFSDRSRDKQNAWEIPQEYASMVDEQLSQSETSLLENKSVLTSISKAFEMKKKHQKNLNPKAATENQESDEDDIFADVGEYVSSLSVNPPGAISSSKEENQVSPSDSVGI